MINKLILVAAALWVTGAEPALAQKTENVAVLVDRSLSLEPDNRDEALKLIVGILKNDLPEGLLEKWRFAPAKTHLNDPAARDYQRKLQDDLVAALQNKGTEFNIPNPNLLFGAIGDLDKTVSNLESAEWEGSTAEKILELGQQASPSDKETHYELGRALISSRLGSDGSYLLFVVSDGVEDLVNLSVSDYLDSRKLTDPASLANGDFLDSEVIEELTTKNEARKNGKPVVKRSGSKIRETIDGYSDKQQGILTTHREGYDEMLVGRFSLNPGELQAFFAGNQRKVPVFVEIYRNSPRPDLVSSFLEPKESTLGLPHTLEEGSGTVSWQIETKNDALKSVTLTIEQIDQNGEVTSVLGKKTLEIEDRSFDLFEAFPDLDGTYRLVLNTESQALKSRSEAFVAYEKPVIPNPIIVLDQEPYLSAKSLEKVVDLSKLGSEFTGERIAAHYELDGETTTDRTPKSVTWVLTPFSNIGGKSSWDEEKSISDTTDEPSPSTFSIQIAEFIDKDDRNFEGFYGRDCRLSIRAIWEDGRAAETKTYLRFPDVELRILGQGEKGNRENPRVVKKGMKKIKFGNWMHPPKGSDMQYHLDLHRWEDGQWIPIHDEDSPLELNHTNEGVTVEVVDEFDGTLRYTVALEYNGDSSGEDSSGVPLADVEGFVEYEGKSLLPYFIGGFALLAILLFLWNLKTRRAR